MLGSGQINQRAAQAAAWHLNNDMSWQELAAKRIRAPTAPSQPYFTSAEIQAAMQIASTAVRTAKEAEQAKDAEKPVTPSSITSPAKSTGK